MKALLCKQYGLPESLVLEEVPTPSISKKQVLISVKACGVNFPDTLIIQGKYQFKPAFPFSPGGELAGVVKAVGEEVSHLNIEDSVFAMPGWGGFAEEIAVDANRVFRMPAGMNYSVAASFMYTYGTSYHALKNRAQLQAGETLLVLGAAGGVGLAAVNLGKIMGAKVIAAASSDEKLALCKAYGADECINYQTQDLREALKNLPESNGVDVVYDPVGGAFTEPALRSLNWKGRHLVVGFAAGQIPSIALNLALLKGCSIMGIFWGAFVEKESKANFQNIQELFDFYQRGILKPHIQKTYALSEAPQALHDLTQRRAMGKLVIVP